MMEADWLPLTELTLQGNLTIAGFAQKTWTAKRGVCEIHLHAKSGLARIDWNHASVIVSPAVIQHGTLDVAEHYERANLAEYEAKAKVAMQASQSAIRETARDFDEKLESPSRADEILAEFDKPEPVTLRRKRRTKTD